MRVRARDSYDTVTEGDCGTYLTTAVSSLYMVHVLHCSYIIHMYLQATSEPRHSIQENLARFSWDRLGRVTLVAWDIVEIIPTFSTGDYKDKSEGIYYSNLSSYIYIYIYMR